MTIMQFAIDMWKGFDLSLILGVIVGILVLDKAERMWRKRGRVVYSVKRDTRISLPKLPSSGPPQQTA